MSSNFARIFDLGAISRLLRDGFGVRFDAAHSACGNVAAELFEKRLGACREVIVRGDVAAESAAVDRGAMARLLERHGSIHLGAASGRDGREVVLMEPGFEVPTSDLVAVMAAYCRLIPGFRGGLLGVARPWFGATAIDKVARSFGVKNHETPGDDLYAESLATAGRVTFWSDAAAQPRSLEIGDALSTTLYWLNILAIERVTLAQVMARHWQRYGRSYFAQRSYAGQNPARMEAFFDDVAKRRRELEGLRLGSYRVRNADIFSLTDSVSKQSWPRLGLCLDFARGARVCLWIGKGLCEHDAALEVTCERFEPSPANHHLDAATATDDLWRSVCAGLRIDAALDAVCP